jgi:membrane protein
LAPATLGFVGFTLLYTFIANRPVRWRHAAAGALTATILFEILKIGFGLYVSAFPTYQAIYGALSVLPILLLWIYLSWLVALLGAEVTAALPEWRGGASGPIKQPPPHLRLRAALALLDKLQAGHDQASPLKRRALSEVPDLAPYLLERVMADLVRRGYAAETGGERYVLARDLTNLPLYQLCIDLDLLPIPRDDAVTDGLLRTVDGALRKDLDLPLKDALSQRRLG